MTVTADAKKRVVLRSANPGQRFDVQVLPDKIIFTPLVEKQVPILKPRRVNGRLMGAAIKLDRAVVAAAVRADRDER